MEFIIDGHALNVAINWLERNVGRTIQNRSWEIIGENWKITFIRFEWNNHYGRWGVNVKDEKSATLAILVLGEFILEGK